MIIDARAMCGILAHVLVHCNINIVFRAIMRALFVTVAAGTLVAHPRRRGRLGIKSGIQTRIEAKSRENLECEILILASLNRVWVHYRNIGVEEMRRLVHVARQLRVMMSSGLTSKQTYLQVRPTRDDTLSLKVLIIDSTHRPTFVAYTL